jgi:hypothetical protein
MFTARMFGLAKLLSKKHKPSPKRNFKPQLESLEKREVMSASSLSLHAVTDVYGNNLAVFEGTYTNNGNQNTGLIFSTNHLGNAGAQSNLIPTGIANTPNAVESFSLGLDANGRGDLFVKATDGSFWDLSEHGWVKLQTPGNLQVETFAAVDGGRVYAIFQDGSLNVFTPTGVSNSAPAPYLVLPSPGTQPFGTWEHVYGAGSVTALDAVTDKYGYDAVYVENADKSFGEFYSPNSGSLPVPAGQAYIGAYTQLASAGHTYWIYGGTVHSTTYSQIGAFSAGTDANGYADVFATWYTGFLDEHIRGTGWKEVAAPQAFQSYSATDSGVAWIIGADGSLERYNGSTVEEVTNSGGPERSVAGASSLTAFVTYPNSEIEGYFLDPNPNNLGQSWGLGTTQY